MFVSRRSGNWNAKGSCTRARTASDELDGALSLLLDACSAFSGLLEGQRGWFGLESFIQDCKLAWGNDLTLNLRLSEGLRFLASLIKSGSGLYGAEVKGWELVLSV